MNFYNTYTQEAGKRAEMMFQELAKQRQYKIIKSKTYFDIHHHWDYQLEVDSLDKSTIIDNLSNFKIDVKSMKKISRTDIEPQDVWVWLEVHGVGENNKGWIYGGLADFIVFETKRSFVFIKRIDLIEIIEKYVDLSCSPETIVKKPEHAKYKLFSRPNRHDLITLVEFKKIEPYIKEIWNKPDYMISQTDKCVHYTSNLNMEHIHRYRQVLKFKSDRIKSIHFKRIKNSIRRYKYCPMCKADLINRIEGLDDTKGNDFGLGVYISNNRHLISC